MEFLDTLRHICKPLDRCGVRFALIGGLALAMRGVQPDWSLIADYLDVFEQSERIDVLRGWHGKAD